MDILHYSEEKRPVLDSTHAPKSKDGAILARVMRGKGKGTMRSSPNSRLVARERRELRAKYGELEDFREFGP